MSTNVQMTSIFIPFYSKQDPNFTELYFFLFDIRAAVIDYFSN